MSEYILRQSNFSCGNAPCPPLLALSHSRYVSVPLFALLPSSCQVENETTFTTWHQESLLGHTLSFLFLFLSLFLFLFPLCLLLLLSLFSLLLLTVPLLPPFTLFLFLPLTLLPGYKTREWLASSQSKNLSINPSAVVWSDLFSASLLALASSLALSLSALRASRCSLVSFTLGVYMIQWC